MAQFWHSFFADTRTQLLLLLVALDLVLGVAASIANKEQRFNLSYVADFGRNDLVGKVVPFLVLYLGYKYATNADLIIPGFDMKVAMDAAWVLVLAALVGSLAKSLSDLGIPIPIPPQLAKSDPSTPNP